MTFLDIYFKIINNSEFSFNFLDLKSYLRKYKVALYNIHKNKTKMVTKMKNQSIISTLFTYLKFIRILKILKDKKKVIYNIFNQKTN